ncbi:hypothetical protein N7528_010149 [Penicillium herquei]|nr:hypothetical protein N7528_010149 [Penicillium herquei]
MSATSNPRAVWKHPYPKTTRIDAFRRHVNRKYGLALRGYNDLHKWSVDQLEAFNAELWEFCGVVCSVPPLSVADGLDKVWPPPKWFPGAKLNYSENLLATGLATHPDLTAISACREGGTDWRHLSWTELKQQVELYASALLNAGVREGDRVGAVSTNSIETALLLLATGWIGAIFSSSAPDMGVRGIVERFLQIRPTIVFVESSVLYASKRIDLSEKLGEVCDKLREGVPELVQVVDISSRSPVKSGIRSSLDQFLNVENISPPPVQVPFDHPIYILYSSGTTGPPKCICHASGRVLLQQKKDFILQFDIGPDSTHYQYTTTGWMMWNYLVGALSTGSRIVLYDGSPLHPTPAYQLQLVEEQQVTHWGTSPKYLAGLKADGLGPSRQLDALQSLNVAGSFLSAEITDWFYTWAPPGVGIFSGSGGTDLVSGIVGGSPLSTLHSGELAAPFLGLQVEIFDATGKNVGNLGQKGDLVITKPFLSMPLTFWGKDGHEKDRRAYFDAFPGVWTHGDFIQRNSKTGGYELLGRSDGVLNPGGVRFGTAELYGIVEKFDQVADSIAVGQRRDHATDEQVLLFLKMKTGQLDRPLRGAIASAIRKLLSARHVPAYILQVRDIPYTMNGKKIENLVRDTVNGKLGVVGATAINPECLQEYKQYLDLPVAKTKPKL